MNHQVMRDNSQNSVQENKKLIEEAREKKLLADKEAEKLMSKVRTSEGDNVREKLLDTIKTAEEAELEYKRKMEQAVKDGIITEEDLETGLQWFQKSDAETKKNVFVASTDERLNFAKKQILKIYDFYKKNEHLWSKEEQKEGIQSFLKMNSMERNEEEDDLAEEKKEREKIHTSMEKLMEDELIDNPDDRKKVFFSLNKSEKEKYLKKLKSELKRRRKVQSKLRDETEKSKELCRAQEWEKALPHCKRAIDIINDNNVIHVEWFKERHGMILDIMGKIEQKMSEENTEDMNKLTTEETTAEQKDEKQETSEQEEISDKRKKELMKLLIRAFMESKKASAASVNAFVHATDADSMLDHQTEVDEKDNILAEDHEEDEDSVLCIEGDITRMMQEKADAIAYDQDLNRKDFAIVDSDEKVLSADASDFFVNRNLDKVMNDIIKTLPISKSERNYLTEALQQIDKQNLGRIIRSDGAQGLDDHEATLGKNFDANKRNFASMVAETILETEN